MADLEQAQSGGDHTIAVKTALASKATALEIAQRAVQFGRRVKQAEALLQRLRENARELDDSRRL